jgi:hypothetical protein
VRPEAGDLPFDLDAGEAGLDQCLEPGRQLTDTQRRFGRFRLAGRLVRLLIAEEQSLGIGH